MFLQLEVQQPCNLNSAEVFTGAINNSVDLIQDLINTAGYKTEVASNLFDSILTFYDFYCQDV